jgi:hypothetical protein
MKFDKLRELYYDPSTGFSGADKLYKRVKELGLPFTKSDIKKFLEDQEVDQVFAKRKVKHYYPLVAYKPFSRIQIDLADVSQLAHWNQRVKFLFCGIDVYSRWAWVIPLKSKSEMEVFNAFKLIVEDIEKRTGFPPSQVDSDMEASFLSRRFKAYCKDKLISQKLLPLEDYKGTAVVDRLIRSLRELINRYLTANTTKTYIDVLPLLVENYDSRVNQGIKTAPIEAVSDPDYDEKYWRIIKNKVSKAKASATKAGYSDFKIGDKVRGLLRKKVFEKGTSQKWSSSIHKVEEMRDGLYFVNGRVSGYKPYELQKVGEVETLPKDEAVATALEEEEKQVVADRRLTRAMNKEGVEAKPSAPRQARVKRPRDFGPVILQ